MTVRNEPRLKRQRRTLRGQPASVKEYARNKLVIKSANVAIVDDDQSIREAIKSLLDSYGLYVEDFPSAEAFLNSGCSEAFDCLILDVRMPGLGGLELQRRLAAMNSRIPIVFITAHYSDGERTKAIEAGAVAFLNKPFTEQALLSAIGFSLE
jgi:FixJ family two-component response regulator